MDPKSPRVQKASGDQNAGQNASASGSRIPVLISETKRAEILQRLAIQRSTMENSSTYKYITLRPARLQESSDSGGKPARASRIPIIKRIRGLSSGSQNASPIPDPQILVLPPEMDRKPTAVDQGADHHSE